jgi:hypothetical protein
VNIGVGNDEGHLIAIIANNRWDASTGLVTL